MEIQARNEKMDATDLAKLIRTIIKEENAQQMMMIQKISDVQIKQQSEMSAFRDEVAKQRTADRQYYDMRFNNVTSQISALGMAAASSASASTQNSQPSQSTWDSSADGDHSALPTPWAGEEPTWAKEQSDLIGNRQEYTHAPYVISGNSDVSASNIAEQMQETPQLHNRIDQWMDSNADDASILNANVRTEELMHSQQQKYAETEVRQTQRHPRCSMQHNPKMCALCKNVFRHKR